MNIVGASYKKDMSSDSFHRQLGKKLVYVANDRPMMAEESYTYLA